MLGTKEDGSDVIGVYPLLPNGTWLTQKMMGTLYDVGTNTINYHIKKIFEDSELQEDSVIRKFRITALDGKGYNTNHYFLEMIIAVSCKRRMPICMAKTRQGVLPMLQT